MASLLIPCYLKPTSMSSQAKFMHSSPFSSAVSSPASSRRSVSLTASASERVELSPQVTDASQAIVQSGDDMLNICRVINGMWQTSGGWGKIDPYAAVDAMLRYADAGFTTFDMADIYGPAEELYGMFIKKVREERGEELASTVKGWDYSDGGYLDALKHLTDLKEEGKIKTLGLTNFDTKRLQIILENKIPVVSNQVQYSVVDTRPQKSMAELCQLSGVKLITYGTVMGGLLSEKFLDTNLSIPFMGPSFNTPSLNKYKQMVDQWGGWNLFQELLQTLKTISAKHRVSIPAVAVKYVLNQSEVAGSMIGVRLGLSEHLQDSKRIFEFQLDEEDEACINQVSRKGRDLMKLIGDCGDEYRRA